MLTPTTPRVAGSLTPRDVIFAWRQAFRVVKHTATRTYLRPIAGAEIPWSGTLNLGAPISGGASSCYVERDLASEIRHSDGTRDVRFILLGAITDAEAIAAVARIAEPARTLHAEIAAAKAALAAREAEAERQLEALLLGAVAPEEVMELEAAFDPLTGTAGAAPMPAAWQAPGESEETLLARELEAERQAARREEEEELAGATHQAAAALEEAPLAWSFNGGAHRLELPGDGGAVVVAWQDGAYRVAAFGEHMPGAGFPFAAEAKRAGIAFAEEILATALRRLRRAVEA